MRERSLNKPAGGSITVFLTLMLLIMLSFVFTTLEAARITAAKSYLAMLSEMASDSLQGSYYYPLFSEYGLLAVDGGYGGTDLSKEKVDLFLNGFLEHSTENTWRGLITANDPETETKEIKTLLTSNDCAFQDQIRQEAVFEGVDLILSGFNDKTLLNAASDISALIDKQENAMKAAGEVSKEVLKLMMYVDGVKTGENGLIVSKEGDLLAAGGFLKTLGVKDVAYMQSTYGNMRVFEAVRSGIYYPGTACPRVISDIEKYEEKTELIKSTEKMIKNQEDRIEALMDELSAIDLNVEGEARQQAEELLEELRHEIYSAKSRFEEEQLKLKEYEAEKKALEVSITQVYNSIRTMLKSSEDMISVTEDAVDTLVVKQKTAKEAAEDYETAAEALSTKYDGLLDGFNDEADGLEDTFQKKDLGYDVNAMIQTLKNNRQWLGNCRLPELDLKQPALVKKNIEAVMNATENIHYNGFKFEYGKIRTSSATGQDVKKVITDILGSGILGVIGVENVSDAGITGEDLVSGGGGNSFATDVWGAFDEMKSLFETSDIGDIIDTAVRGVTDDLMTEIYLRNNFSLYSKQRDDTRLRYEREYVLFGDIKDKSNLNATALRLTGLRTVFTFAALMSDGLRNGQAEALGELVAGLTGIAPLLYVVKYTILIVWAIEEALIEVCALFKGKPVKLFQRAGRVGIEELLMMTPAYIQVKAEGVDDMGGAKYSDYVTVLSFFVNRKRKNDRMMDLIQENIRYRFRDTFRIRNCITNVDFEMSYAFIKKFDTGFFGRDVYDMTYAAHMDYLN
ncbi:MAG: hypothetical protein J6Z46_04860 [Lachnospiraceae bacterium]|nr:hypothetical protein [Lachnospiraceae bacterium]